MSKRTLKRKQAAAAIFRNRRHRRSALTKKLKRQLHPGFSAKTPQVAAQVACHAVFDRLWCGPDAIMSRGRAYTYLQNLTGWSIADAHIRNLSIDECHGLMEKVQEDFPRVFQKSA